MEQSKGKKLDQIIEKLGETCIERWKGRTGSCSLESDNFKAIVSYNNYSNIYVF